MQNVLFLFDVTIVNLFQLKESIHLFQFSDSKTTLPLEIIQQNKLTAECYQTNGICISIYLISLLCINIMDWYYNTVHRLHTMKFCKQKKSNLAKIECKDKDKNQTHTDKDEDRTLKDKD